MIPCEINGKTGIPNSLTTSPFLKWAGGKAQLLTQYTPLFPKKFHSYLEPFLGGGAVYFKLVPKSAILSDINDELINAYLVIREDVENLIGCLSTHKNESEYFYSIRRLDPTKLSKIERASRFIYLNRTCYNGLYRVNKNGEFNVPFGRYKTTIIYNEENLRKVSLQIQNAEIATADFDIVLKQAKKDDFVYFDPPYQPLSKTAHFTKYAQNGFGEVEQIRLANVFQELDKRGCFLLLTNSDMPFIRDLYKNYNVNVVNARRAINCKPHARKNIKELVIRNYL
jgi:DNA adenine methylase